MLEDFPERQGHDREAVLGNRGMIFPGDSSSSALALEELQIGEQLRLHDAGFHLTWDDGLAALQRHAQPSHLSPDDMA